MNARIYPEITIRFSSDEMKRLNLKQELTYWGLTETPANGRNGIFYTGRLHTFRKLSEALRFPDLRRRADEAPWNNASEVNV